VKSDKLANRLIEAATKTPKLAMGDTIPPMTISEEEARDIVDTSSNGNDQSYIRETASGELREFLIHLGELPEVVQRGVIEELRNGKSRRCVIHIDTYGSEIPRQIVRVTGGKRQYTVPSATSGDVKYLIEVENGQPTCTCVGFTLRGKCHHVNEPDTWTPIN